MLAYYKVLQLHQYVPDDGGLTDTEAGNEAPGINRSKVAIDATNHEDDDADNPQSAEKTGRIDSADSVTYGKRTVKQKESVSAPRTQKHFRWYRIVAPASTRLAHPEQGSQATVEGLRPPRDAKLRGVLFSPPIP